MTRCWRSLRGGRSWFGRVVTAKGTLAGQSRGGKITRNAAREWLDDVNEWRGLSSKESWSEPEENVAWRMRVSCIRDPRKSY